MIRLKIFTDKQFVRENAKYKYLPLLYPFWGECHPGLNYNDHGRFSEYINCNKELFSLVSIDEADVVLLPSEWPEGGKYTKADSLFELAKQHKKPVLIFFNSDSFEKISVNNSIIFRTTMYSNQRKNEEFALPCWSVDFLNYSSTKKLCIRKKEEIPVVSYCGYVDYSKKFDKSFIYYLVRLVLYGAETNPGKPLRGKAVRKLSSSKFINTNFIIRNKTLNYSPTTLDDVRLEYAQNMLDSDYALVVRGKGNFSYRLYEVLSCGRIPVFINTDCVLPFDHIIDWKKIMVWVESHEIDSIDIKVKEFHASLSNKDFMDLQVLIRKIYEEWICPLGFYSNLWRCLNLPDPPN